MKKIYETIDFKELKLKMGEVNDMIYDGVLCEVCGDFIDNNHKGVPRVCDVCTKRWLAVDNKGRTILNSYK